MGNHVAIEKILVNRTLDLNGPDNISDLAKHIHDTGLQVPILVNQDYELIDGLRRLEAIRSLGQVTVEVVAVTMYGPALAWIQKAREHGVLARPLTPRRLYELYSACQPLMSVSRSHEMKGTQHGRGVHINGRSRFLAATGIEAESYLQAVTQLYKLTREDSVRGRLAQEYADQLDRGQISPYMALERIRQRQRHGDIVKGDDQMALLNHTVDTLNGIAYGIAQLGSIDEGLSAESLAYVTKELRKFRRTLHRFIHQLDKEQDSR